MTKYVELNKLGTLARGKSKHRPRNDEILFEDGYIPFIQTADVKDACLYINKATCFYNKKGLEQSRLWKQGTLCITIAANIAETALLGIDACFPDSIVGFVNDNSLCNIKYIKYCFDVLKNSYQQISHGTSQENLNLENLNTLLIPYVDLPKQHHIVDIIGSIDEAINIKKQLADKILDNIMYIFDFIISSKNKTKIPLSKISNLSLGGTPNTSIEKYWNGNINWINSGRLNDKCILESDEKITNEALINSSTVLCKKNSIVISITGNIMVSILGIDTAINQSIVAIETNEKYRCFLYCYLKKAIPHLTKLRTGAVQPHINKEIIEKYIIELPREEDLSFFYGITLNLFDKFVKLHEEIKKTQYYKMFLLPLMLNGQIL